MTTEHTALIASYTYSQYMYITKLPYMSGGLVLWIGCSLITRGNRDSDLLDAYSAAAQSTAAAGPHSFIHSFIYRPVKPFIRLRLHQSTLYKCVSRLTAAAVSCQSHTVLHRVLAHHCESPLCLAVNKRKRTQYSDNSESEQTVLLVIYIKLKFNMNAIKIAFFSTRRNKSVHLFSFNVQQYTAINV